MKIGTSFSALAVASVLLFGVGCDAGTIEFGSDPYLVGDRGNLRFWITEGCGFSNTCTPEVGFPLNADELGIEAEVVAVANSDAVPLVILPDLVFSSRNPGRFSVRSVQCRDRWSPDRLPCPTEEGTISYIVTLDLHSEGRADLEARLADDGSLYDRGTVRVQPPR
jgi:hypothetical protein